MNAPTTSTSTIGSNVALEGSAAPLKLLDLHAQFTSIRDEVATAIASVLESQQFILGKEVQLFESEIATFLDVPFAIGCASGSDALYLALCAMDIGPGDEVITTPFTFVATAGAIARAGATPVFVDIDPATFNIDPARVADAITNRTRSILPVHLFGLPADLEPILNIAQHHQLVVIEDAAQAIGATYRGRSVGGYGEFGCFSFFPSKNLGCAGDGGLVTTQTPETADRLRLLRAHGSRRKYFSEVLGMNSRLDALQAAILRVKLKRLNDWQARRQSHAALYRQLFQEHKLEGKVELPATAPDCTHVYNQFVIRCKDREQLRAHLDRAGIPTEVYYPTPLHLQPAFAYLGYGPGSFPHTELACRQVLALPIYPELTETDQERVVDCISDVYSA
jgi:dTDP-4-amino-4,6-dideoxygalactose transaminase